MRLCSTGNGHLGADHIAGGRRAAQAGAGKLGRLRQSGRPSGGEFNIQGQPRVIISELHTGIQVDFHVACPDVGLDQLNGFLHGDFRRLFLPDRGTKVITP